MDTADNGDDKKMNDMHILRIVSGLKPGQPVRGTRTGVVSGLMPRMGAEEAVSAADSGGWQ